MIIDFAHRLKIQTTIWGLLLAVLMLSGCAAARRELGFEKAPPDEFAVIARAPLSQPPDYMLRPPAPGAARPQEGSPVDLAHDALVGRAAASASAARSPGEKAIVTMSGGDKANKDIRRTLEEETTGFVQAGNGFVDKILFWREPTGKNAQLLDANSEAQRIRDNATNGKAPVDGESPIISDKKSSNWLPEIF